MARLVLPILLALFESALIADGASASPPPKIVGFGPDLITVLSKPPLRDRKTGVLEGVELQGEVTSEAVATANGWRSMRATLDVSCRGGLDRVRAMTVFSEHNGKGEAKALTPPDDWIAPSQNTTYGLAVVKFFCGDSGAKSMARLGASDDAPPARATPTAPVSSYAHAAAPPAAASSPPLTPEPQPDAGTTNQTGVAGPAASKSWGHASAGAPAVSKPADRPSARVNKGAAPGAFAVQVGSTTAESEAKVILASLEAAHGQAFGGLQPRIEQAEVKGQRHYRAIVSGFADATSAARFCTDLHPPNGCLVRRGP